MKNRKYLMLLLLVVSILFDACKKTNETDTENRTQMLLDEANARVYPSYPAAILLEVHGMIADKHGFFAQDVNEYEFVYGLSNQTLLLHWRNGVFDTPELVDLPWLGSFPLPLPLNLSLSDAIQTMRIFGCSSPFAAVTIREPIVMTIYTEAFYIFSFPNMPFIFVGTKTGKVFEVSS